MAFHEPVMVEEVLEVLEEARDGVLFDGTVGGGGHAWAFLSRWPRCRLVATDRDPSALEAARHRLAPFADRVTFLALPFHEAALHDSVRSKGIHGAFLDLGVSSHQLDTPGRGFAFRPGEPLDMRMEGETGGVTAADLLNSWDEGRLADLFFRFGDEPRSRPLAREIVRRRDRRPFRLSDDLVAAMAAAYGRGPSPREKARVFQALRMAVNEEIPGLEQGLPRLRDALRPGGILAVLSYHSVEDRVVKQMFRSWSEPCICPPGLPVCGCGRTALGTPVFQGAKRPTREEISANPRARSARLRAWRRGAP